MNINAQPVRVYTVYAATKFGREGFVVDSAEQVSIVSELLQLTGEPATYYTLAQLPNLLMALHSREAVTDIVVSSAAAK